MQAVLFVFLLLIASVCDLRKWEIPDWVNGAIAVAFLLCFRPVNLWGVIPSLFFLAGAMKGGIGGGDVKLAAACGLVLGLPAALAGTILGLSFQARLFRGWTVKQAIETGLREKVREGNPVVYQGTSFPSVKALSNALELPYSSLSHLYGRLQDIEKAVERCMEMPEREVVLWGKAYANYSQVALAFGLNRSVVIQRVREGNELEDVVKDALSKEPITLYGEVYQNFVDLCAAYKIQPSNGYERLRYGMSLEEAMTRPIKEIKHGEPVEYRGKTYPSKVALCREYGLSVNCVYEQLDTNPITFMESFEILCRLKARAKISQDEAMNYIPRCRVRGENYKTVYEFVYQFGITASTVYTYKSRHQCADLFEALRGMQGESRTAYPIDGKILFGTEVRKQYGQAQLKRIQDQKIEVPRYPSLQGFDFQTECYDTMAIYYELLEELEQEKKLGEGMEQEENVELGGLSL